MDLTEERAGRNEALFREVNEQVRRLNERSDKTTESADFVCECSLETCAERVPVALRAYEAVRANPRRFIVLPGHDNDFEHIVERNDGYYVVEKEGAAARIAERNDPRS